MCVAIIIDVLTKLIAVGIIYTISFLGYNPNDFLNILPAPIKSVFEQSTTSPVTEQISTTTEIPIVRKISTSTPVKTEKKNITATSSITLDKILPQKTNKLLQTSTTQTIHLGELKGQATKTIIIATSTIPQPITQNNPIQTSGNLLSASASISEKISDSVVNVYCQAIRGSQIETVVGSAVEIDPSGVYLTNAHVALWVMLSDTQPAGTVSCFIREGSPAKKIYSAETVYIPSDWIYAHTNAYEIGIELTGTGENDYAIIKRGIANPNLNANDFPQEWSATIAPNIPSKGENITLAGYPVFDKSTISSALYLLANPSTVLNSFNLNGEENALLDSDSTKLAQVGSSGGGAFDSNGNLFGIMDAAINNTPGELPSERIVGINYIKNDILKDTGKSFENIISNANSESQNFIKNSAPTLSEVLISNQ